MQFLIKALKDYDFQSIEQMDVSRFYRNTDFSEQTLILYNEQNEKKDMYPVHHIIWSAASTYFESLFVRWDNKKKDIITMCKRIM